jgi:hypothetical protein
VIEVDMHDRLFKFPDSRQKRRDPSHEAMSNSEIPTAATPADARHIVLLPSISISPHDPAAIEYSFVRIVCIVDVTLANPLPSMLKSSFHPAKKRKQTN